MTAWSFEIANEFIRRAKAEGRALTQMQLQKLVYIAHGWNLAINGAPLTKDDPHAWDYGPVYKDLREVLRNYGPDEVSREIIYRDSAYGSFLSDNTEKLAVATLSKPEIEVIDRVFTDYGKFHAFQLSALTHQDGSPWDTVYAKGEGKNKVIEPGLIKDYFIALATSS